jgi:hypothetical protein
MRSKHLVPFIVSCALLPLPISAQQAFEGTIKYHIRGQGVDSEMVQHVSGDRIRVEMSTAMGASIMIMDTRAETMLVLMPAQKMYMKMDLQSAAELADQLQAGKRQEMEEDFSLTATGKKETIAGHECEHYTMKQGDSAVDVCAAKGLGFYMGSNRGMSGPGRGEQQRGMGGLSKAQEAALRARFKDGFLPLRTEVGGMIMEATSIEMKKLPTDLFKAPEGYNEMKVPGRL